MLETTVESVIAGRPKTVTPSTAVDDAASLLRRPGTAVLPVLEDGAVVGVLTGSDLVAMVAETSARPVVGTVMSTPATTVSPTATLTAAAERMRDAGVKHLPVVDDGHCIGVLSATDLAPYLPRNRLAVEWRGDPLQFVSVDRNEAAAGD